jgi:serine/threonine protein phosphatase PrpC
MPLADIGSFLRDPSVERLDAWVQRVESDAAHRQEALDLARRLLAIEKPASTSVHGGRAGKGSVTRLRSASRTDIGRVRDSHEDAVVRDDRLALVADGMGGHSGGEVASAMAAAVVQATFTGHSIDELRAAVRTANRAIWERSRGNSDLEGMGTTLSVAGLTDNGDLAVVHVGDSRLYMFRDGSLRQLTVDHSFTAELVRVGELSEQEARDHPHRGLLTRALGVGPDVELDSAAYPALEGDRLLLCSDGLFNEVLDHEISSVMAGTPHVQAASDQLVEMALSRGGHDNISVVVAEVCA